MTGSRPRGRPDYDRSTTAVSQAVYAYAGEDADWWAAELGCPIAPGRFGENLTTAGLDVTGAVLGERWRIGDDGRAAQVTARASRAGRSRAGWTNRTGSSGSPSTARPAPTCGSVAGHGRRGRRDRGRRTARPWRHDRRGLRDPPRAAQTALLQMLEMPVPACPHSPTVRRPTLRPASSSDGRSLRGLRARAVLPTRCGYCDFNTYTATELGGGATAAGPRRTRSSPSTSCGSPVGCSVTANCPRARCSSAAGRPRCCRRATSARSSARCVTSSASPRTRR